MSPESLEHVRRAEATRTFLRYFFLAFMVVLSLSGLVAYAIYDGIERRHESRSIRLAYCIELEKLKTQNREDVYEKRRNFERDLRLLGIKDTPELRQAARESWRKRLERNAPKTCPYEG